MKEKKIEIVIKMVQNGYCLFDETVEHFADRFDLATLLYFEKNFSAHLKE